MYMAASLGLCHETFAYPPAAASSYCFPPDLVATNFAAMADHYFPELGVHPPAGYYSPPQVFAGENEQMNMSYADHDGRWMSRSAASAVNGGAGGRASSRIGFRTRSEVDVLDDGFKWRKYGKKAVKSSPNPRNYYRCSAEGCGVKKRVERDPEDPRYVVTTYDGVHNHAAPCCAAAGYYHHAPPPYAATTTLLPAPAPCPDVWGVQQQQQQLHAAAATVTHSSESSY